jgi:ribosomal protein S18 acetylase RimI-like enzyme
LRRSILVEYQAAWLDELVPMWRASFEAGVGVKDPHPIAEQKNYFVTQVLPRNSVRMAMLEEQLVGFIAASRESVAQLHVRIGFQRRGIGRRMLAWAKEQSGGSLWLYTFARNQGAQRFYEREGFRIVARGFEPMWQLEDIKYEWTRGDPV